MLFGKRKKRQPEIPETNDTGAFDENSDISTLLPAKAQTHCFCHTSQFESKIGDVLGKEWLEAIEMPGSGNWLVFVKTQRPNPEPTTECPDDYLEESKSYNPAQPAMSFPDMLRTLITYEFSNESMEHQRVENNTKPNLGKNPDHILNVAPNEGVLYDRQGNLHPTLNGRTITTGQFGQTTLHKAFAAAHKNDSASQKSSGNMHGFLHSIHTGTLSQPDILECVTERPDIETVFAKLKDMIGMTHSRYKSRNYTEDKFKNIATIHKQVSTGGDNDYYTYCLFKHLPITLSRINALKNTCLKKLCKTFFVEFEIAMTTAVLKDAVKEGHDGAVAHLKTYIDDRGTTLKRMGHSQGFVDTLRAVYAAKTFDEIIADMQKAIACFETDLESMVKTVKDHANTLLRQKLAEPKNI